MISSYRKFLFKDIFSWFDELTELANNVEDNSNLPELELLLQNGHIIRGCIIESQKNAQEYLLMITTNPNAYSKSEIILVSAFQVVALKLIEPNNYISIFASSENTHVIGALELKRTINDIEEQLEKISSEKINLYFDVDSCPSNKRYDISRRVKMLPAIFSSLVSDELGKKILSEKIKNIKISIADINSETLIQNTLQLEFAGSAPFFQNKESKRIEIAIENLL